MTKAEIKAKEKAKKKAKEEDSDESMQADEVDKIMAMRKNKVKMSNMQSEKPKDSKPMEIVEEIEGGENDTSF